MAPKGLVFKSARALLSQDALLVEIFQSVVRVVARLECAVMVSTELLIKCFPTIETFGIQRFDAAEFRYLFFDEPVEMSAWIGLPATDPVPEAKIDIQSVIAHGEEWVFTPTPVVLGRADPDGPDADLTLKKINKRRCVF